MTVVAFSWQLRAAEFPLLSAEPTLSMRGYQMAASKESGNPFFDGRELLAYNPDGVIAGDFNWGDVVGHEVRPLLGLWQACADPLGLSFFPVIEPVCTEEPEVLTPLGNSPEELLHCYSRDMARERRENRLLPLAGCDLFANNYLFINPEQQVNRDLLAREVGWDF